MHMTIMLTRGKCAIVDVDDFLLLAPYKWFAHRWPNGKGFYAARRRTLADGPGSQLMLMHKIICQTPDGYHTDHINHDGLDNRKENLRILSPSENQANQKTGRGRSGYRGVTKVPRCARWQARITKNRVEYYIGIFKTPEEAAIAVDAKGKELFGEAFNPNFG